MGRHIRTTTRMRMVSPDWCCLILAGGKSSRMGSDKARLQWKGRPILQVLSERFRAAGASDVLVSGHHPEFGGIEDQRPDGGPLEGIQSSLSQRPDGLWLIVPVDMPALQREHIAPLIESPIRASALAYSRHVLPMRVRLNSRFRSCLASLTSAGVEARKRSLTELFRRLEGSRIDCPADLSSGLLNCNMPEEWEASQQ